MFLHKSIALLREAHVTWLNEIEWDIAFTLNFRSNIHEIIARNAVKHYFHKLDCSLFGTRKASKGQRLRRAIFLEGEASVRNWHYHGVLKMVDVTGECKLDKNITCDPIIFSEYVKNCWENIAEAGKFSKVAPIYTQHGWITYITREILPNSNTLDTNITYL